MDEKLKEYLKSVEETATKYENGKVETKEFLPSMQEIEKWLQERCDANPHNR